MKLSLTKLWEAMPPDVQRKVSLHDLKRTVDAYNGEVPPPLTEDEVKRAFTFEYLKEPLMVLKAGKEFWQYRTGGYDFESQTTGMCEKKSQAEAILRKHWNR